MGKTLNESALEFSKSLYGYFQRIGHKFKNKGYEVFSTNSSWNWNFEGYLNYFYKYDSYKFKCPSDSAMIDNGDFHCPIIMSPELVNIEGNKDVVSKVHFGFEDYSSVLSPGRGYSPSDEDSQFKNDLAHSIASCERRFIRSVISPNEKRYFHYNLKSEKNLFSYKVIDKKIPHFNAGNFVEELIDMATRAKNLQKIIEEYEPNLRDLRKHFNKDVWKTNKEILDRFMKDNKD